MYNNNIKLKLRMYIILFFICLITKIPIFQKGYIHPDRFYWPIFFQKAYEKNPDSFLKVIYNNQELYYYIDEEVREVYVIHIMGFLVGSRVTKDNIIVFVFTKDSIEKKDFNPIDIIRIKDS